jgi:hypothetical protein
MSKDLAQRRKDAKMKEKSVVDVVRWLEETLRQSLLTVDYWEADMFAIGVTQSHNPDQIVYISAWNRPPGRYSVELEGEAVAGSNLPYRTLARHEDVDRDALLRIVRAHLHI